MKDHVTPRIAAATLVAAALFWHTQSATAEPGPVVVELFTSQGCNSCPPADRLLGELADRDDVLPLSFHVTYWDRLGWPDTFGLEGSTQRQEGYADWLGLNRVYTPQMVIGGRIDVVGSARGRVLEAIELLHSHAEPGPQLAVTGDRLAVGAGSRDDATVWLIAFDDHHDVAIERGENRGRTIRYRNVVRKILDLGAWDGRATTLRLPLERLAAGGRDAVAVLVQREADGAILAAERVDLPPG
jgi:hypothetical protein